MTDADRIAKLEQSVETLLGIIAGHTCVITALVRTHHDIDKLKMMGATTVEVMENGALGKTLTERQRLLAREVAEQCLRTPPERPRTSPTGT